MTGHNLIASGLVPNTVQTFNGLKPRSLSDNLIAAF
jgi:hypothetical protein